MNLKDELYYSAIDLLHRLIGTPSISREEDAAAQIICETLQKNGFTPYRTGNNIWTFAREFDSEKPTVLLNSHIDTVKPTDSWSRSPFVPIEEDNRLYGLGSNDAGASVVSLLSAFIHLSETEQPYNLVFLASAEEEVSGQNGIVKALEQLPTIDFAVVGEPTGMQPAVCEKGCLYSIVPHMESRDTPLATKESMPCTKPPKRSKPYEHSSFRSLPIYWEK